MTLDLPDLDPRIAAILQAAFAAFCQYGYRRTSMEDIAQGAGMSRAALYLHYRNKEDILRSFTQVYFDQSLVEVQRILTPGRDVVEALSDLVASAGGPKIEQIIASAHGQELLEAKQSACGDVVSAGVARVNAAVAAWLSDEADAGRVDLSAVGGNAGAVASMLFNAWHGLKENAATPTAFVTGGQDLARLFGRALRP